MSEMKPLRDCHPHTLCVSSAPHHPLPQPFHTKAQSSSDLTFVAEYRSNRLFQSSNAAEEGYSAVRNALIELFDEWLLQFPIEVSNPTGEQYREFADKGLIEERVSVFLSGHEDGAQQRMDLHGEIYLTSKGSRFIKQILG